MNWLRNLFKPRCQHHWQDTHTANRIGFRGVCGVVFFQQCKKCGDRRAVEL